MSSNSKFRNHHLVSTITLFFIIPNFMFAFQLHFLPCLIVIIGCVFAAWVVSRPACLAEGSLLAGAVDARALTASLIVALVLLVLGGEGHFFYANTDWLIRDAVLADMGRSAHIPFYVVANTQYLLRAPLGMYEIPALCSRLFGLYSSHIALLIQNALILGSLIYLIYILPGSRGLFVVFLVIIFSGLDIVGELFVRWAHRAPLALSAFPSHIEDWTHEWQYSSEITQIFWVPNHALPGWWLAMLAFLCASDEVSLGVLGLSIATSAFWSPLSAIGAVPFAIVLFARRWKSQIASWRFWTCAAASLTFLPIAAYLTAASGSIHHGSALTDQASIIEIIIFLLIETPQLLLLGAAFSRQSPSEKSLILTSSVMLIALPFIEFGPNNDLEMRSSIVSLLLLAIIFSDTFINKMRDRPCWRLVATVLIIVGSLTPCLEVARAFIFPRYSVSNCNMAQVQGAYSPGGVATNYMARTDAVPAWLLTPSATDAPLRPFEKSCWPDYPFSIRSYVGAYSNAELLRSQRGH